METGLKMDRERMEKGSKKVGERMEKVSLKRRKKWRMGWQGQEVDFWPSPSICQA